MAPDPSTRDRVAFSNDMAPDPSTRDLKPVLIITYYWPPAGGSGVQRFLKFSAYLPAYGLEPVILTCSNATWPVRDHSLCDEVPQQTQVHKAYSLNPFSLYSRLTGKSAEELADPAISLSSSITTPGRSGKLVRWIRANLFVPDARIGWVPFARRKALKLIDTHDIKTVITTGPPHSTHLIGTWLAARRPVRWIADLRDPWTEIHYNRLLPRSSLAKRIDAQLERRVLCRAHELVVTAPGTARYYEQKSGRSVHTIVNGFDERDFEPPSHNRSEQIGFCERSTLLVRHTGTISESSIPHGLLQAMLLDSMSGVQLECTGSCHGYLRRFIGEHQMEQRIVLRAYVPHTEAVRLMQQADVNLVVVQQSSDSRMLIPGKLYDALAAGRPILLLGDPDGDAAAILDRCGMGRAFHYDDVSGIGQWLIRARARLYMDSAGSAGSIAGFDPVPEEIARFSRKKLTEKLARLLHG